MTLRFIEGFDHLAATDLTSTGKWGVSGSGSPSLVASRFGLSAGTALALTSAVGPGAAAFGPVATRTLGVNLGTAPAFIVVGFAFTPGPGGAPTSVDTRNFFAALIDNATAQLTLSFSASGAVSLWRGVGSALLGTSSAPLIAGQWYYFEIKAGIDPAAGFVTVRINQTAVITVTGLNTRNTANSFVNVVQLGFNNVSVGSQQDSYDDVYVLDSAGTVNNDFLGECRVATLLPSAASADGTGAHTQWVPNTGTNFAAVNETLENADTTFVSSSTVGQIDTYTMADMPTGALTVQGIQYNLVARKDDAGTRQVAGVYRRIGAGGADFVGPTSLNLSTSYLDQTALVETNPDTGVAFTPADLNAAEFGIKVVT